MKKKVAQVGSTSKSTSDRFCYLDETGNTGLNHFDEAQEVFMQGCTVANSDLDLSLKSTFDKIHETLGVSELHANVLGTRKLNSIASAVCNAIADNDVAFIFTIIDKKYYVRLMIFHLIFDPGVNPAVSSFSIWNRQLRLSLSYNFIQLINEDACRKFWTSAKESTKTSLFPF